MSVCFQVPFALLVSDNAANVQVWKTFKSGKRRSVMARSNAYRAGQTVIQTLARRGMNGAKPLGAPAALRLTFYWPDRQRRDATNYLKQLLDALTGVVFEDDAWKVLRLVEIVNAGTDKKDPHVVVEAERLDANLEEQ